MRQTDQELARSLYPNLTVTDLAKNMFICRLLLTPWPFNPALTYGDLMVHVYVVLYALRGAHATRDALALRDARVAKKSGWAGIRTKFIREFPAFLINSLVKGPYWTPITAIRVWDLPSDNPVYHFVVIPILKMFKGMFPMDFGFNQTMHLDPRDFVNNQKNRLRAFGVYSSVHLETAITTYGDDLSRYAFLGGGFYWHYRALTLINRTFDRGSREGLKKFSSFNLTREELLHLERGYSMVPDWIATPKRCRAVTWHPDPLPALAVPNVNVVIVAPVGNVENDEE